MRCPACDQPNPPSAAACLACGQPLPRTSAHADRPDGERKQVTVLFADVTGSMELSEQIGPDRWRTIMERLFLILSEGVHRFEGTVDKFTGDGIMALFGAPVAHEDHARRACYSALHLRREIDTLAARLEQEHGLRLSVRMGLNSGEVAVGALGADRAAAYTAVGHTVGLARRVEQLAEPGTAYVTEHTAALAEGYVELADRGTFDIKGARESVRVHELTGIGAARGWLDVARARGLSGFVGRERELRMLEEAMDRALAGEGGVVGIVGEPGVGKSRLCHEFVERIRARRLSVSYVAGQAHARSVPLVPLLESVRSYFGVTERDPAATARARITAGVIALDADAAGEVPLLFDFLGVPDPERRPPRMNPDARQRRLLGLLKRLTQARSRREPGVFVFEDLHWLDPASAIFLANQIEAIPGTRSLVVLNFRPEYRAPWMRQPFYRELELTPLDETAVDALLAGLLGGDGSLAELARLIRDRTRGNPFFIEESVQALVETGDLRGERGALRLVGEVGDITVPATVHAVLAARIDRLAAAGKDVLQIAAVIGRDVPAGVLARVARLERAELDAAVRALIEGDFLVEQEHFPEVRYAFRHPLTREVAYGSQLAERRAAVHAAVAEAITAAHPERLDERAAEIAEHWEAAGQTLPAARCHARAAAWAGTTEPASALHHARRAAALAAGSPESEQARALGLTAHLFALEFGWRLGISHDEARAEFVAADRLAEGVDDPRARATLLGIYGLIRAVNDGHLREGLLIARQAWAIAAASGDPDLLMAIAPVAYVFLTTGDLREGIAICDRALERASGDVGAGAGTLIGCPYALSVILKSAFLHDLGDVGEARRLIEDGREIARAEGDLETVGLSHSLSVRHAFFADDPAAALAHARSALEIAERIGSTQSRSRAWLSLGAAQRAGGRWAEAVAALERSRALAIEHRAGVDVDGWRLALLAEAHQALGAVARAVELAREGLASARIGGAYFSEIYASVTLARVARAPGACVEDDVAAALDRALDLVRSSGARTFAAMVETERALLAAS